MIQRVASEGGRFTPARQIWPPGLRLSSTTIGAEPPSAAATAAAIPAGPPPMITICADLELCIGDDFHAIDAEHLAGTLVRISVDSHEALKADAHPAKGTAWLAGDRQSEGRNATSKDRSGDARSTRDCATGAVDFQSDCLSHLTRTTRRFRDNIVGAGLVPAHRRRPAPGSPLTTSSLTGAVRW